MSTIEFDHRNEAAPNDLASYHALSEALVPELFNLPDIRSVVLCGSLTKQTLVPGWSDLDVIVLTEDKAMADGLRRIGEVIGKAQARWPVPVGADVVSCSAFARSLRFGGRPLAMTFEVAASGCVAAGEDVLSAVKWDPSLLGAVADDVARLIPAELHNWRRWLIACGAHDDDVNALRRNVKTCLKLAKYESDPALEPPFSYEQAVESLRQRHHSGPVDVWALAADTRANWNGIISRPTEIALRNRVFRTTLAGYKL